MKWGSSQGQFGLDSPPAPPPAAEDCIDGVYSIKVVDLFRLIPCSPFGPKLAVTTRVLEMFRINRLRCPTLSIQSWVKSLCDLHGRVFQPYLVQQFTICFDLYLETLRTVDERVAKALGRDGPDWRLKNCCPACTYKLEGEDKLIFSMLMTMDGNDSLKRILRKDKTFDEEGNSTRGRSQRNDPRTEGSGGDYFLSRERVDLWSKEVLQGLVDVPVYDPAENSACQERWKNLKEEMTSRMWGIFDETGVFLSLCRHGFVLVLADMVKSGELAKYPLAVVEAVLDAFGPDVGGGYDIGCGFGTTLKKSPLGERAEGLNYRSLVGAFHGHAHNRLCQLAFLATYVPGMGLEDLEGCERFFSKSNALARSTRYASIFHRRQSIATYLAHTDTFDTYANLSTFLVNNYKQAVQILGTVDALYASMDQLGIQDLAEFHSRIEEETVYLKALGHDLEENTDEIDYLKRLITLMEMQEKLDLALGENSRSTATTKRLARERFDQALEDVQESEQKLEIEQRWEWGSEPWEEALTLLSTKQYRKSINDLEALVLKRMFELTKMNMSGTGYKLRKHIAKALQTRSQAIRNALARYNTAASALDPPGRQLNWDEVLNYTFLSEWDLLRDPSGNAQLRPWASPAARLVLDAFFKIERAQEEIDRLNIEIRRFITYMRDEKLFLDHHVRVVAETDPILAFFIRRYQERRGRFDEGHKKRLAKMAKKMGRNFTGTLIPGKRVIEEEEEQISFSEEDDEEWEDEEWEDEEGEDAEDEELAEMMETVLVLATDREAVEVDQ
ncbi:hypothetical protein GGX14DRAFT_537230 [Mycena pura]|uniref:CxC1-like cysteine cluster associated with KDZ transposases domain-containing protein n=1 Tax=Mycena pura TaxID=153505 RepID=A0AAD6UV75_9AGAR|nr:hypothetical protein GGX14DRAFT_537230 [Mycena pura]